MFYMGGGDGSRIKIESNLVKVETVDGGIMAFVSRNLLRFVFCFHFLCCL